MATVRGREEVRRFMAQLPARLALKVLPGAARAGAKVVAAEIKATAPSDEVRDGVEIKARSEPGRVVVRITIKEGWPRSVATWAEYGTDPHIVSVADDRDRQGMSIGRINRLAKAGTLAIGGQAIGKIVHHPGARPHPFMRPAPDIKAAEAIAEAQRYINSRISRGGIVGADDPESEDA